MCFVALVALLIAETTIDIIGGFYLAAGIVLVVVPGFHRVLTRSAIRWLVLYNWAVIVVKVGWQAYWFPPYSLTSLPQWEQREDFNEFEVNFKSSCVGGTTLTLESGEHFVCFSWERFFGTNKFARSTFCEDGGVGGSNNCRALLSDKNGLFPSLVFFVLLSVLTEVAGYVFVSNHGSRRSTKAVARAVASQRRARAHLERARAERNVEKALEYAAEKEALLHLVQNMSKRMNAWDSEGSAALRDAVDEDEDGATSVFARVPATIRQPAVAADAAADAAAVDDDDAAAAASASVDARCALRVSWHAPQSVGSRIVAYCVEVSSPHEAPPYIACFFPAGVFPSDSGASGGERSATVFGLLPATPYVFRVAAVNSHGTGEYSQPSTVARTPAVPESAAEGAAEPAASVRLTSCKVHERGLGALVASARSALGGSASTIHQMRLDAARHALLFYRFENDGAALDGAALEAADDAAPGAGSGEAAAVSATDASVATDSGFTARTISAALSLRSVRAVRWPHDAWHDNRRSIELILDSDCAADEIEGQLVIDPFALERVPVAAWARSGATPRRAAPFAPHAAGARFSVGDMVRFKDRFVSAFDFGCTGRVTAVGVGGPGIGGNDATVEYAIYCAANTKTHQRVSADDICPLAHRRVVVEFTTRADAEAWRRRISALVPRQACAQSGELPHAVRVVLARDSGDAGGGARAPLLEPACNTAAPFAWKVRTSMGASPAAEVPSPATHRWLCGPWARRPENNARGNGAVAEPTAPHSGSWMPFEGHASPRASERVGPAPLGWLSPRARLGSAVAGAGAPAVADAAAAPASGGTAHRVHRSGSSLEIFFRDRLSVVRHEAKAETPRQHAAHALGDAHEPHSRAARATAWVQVDFGRNATIERVELATAGVSAVPRHWHVERASDDGSAWIGAFDGALLGVIGRDGNALAAATGGAEAAGGSITQAVESGTHGAGSTARFWRITLRGYRGAETLQVDALRFYGRYADTALESDAESDAARVGSSDATPPPSRERSTVDWAKNVTRAAFTYVDRHYSDFHRVAAVDAAELQSHGDAADAGDVQLRAEPGCALGGARGGAPRHLGAVVISTLYHLALTHSAALVYAAIALYHVANASLLSMPLPIAAVCYALVEYPRPAPRMWTWIAGYVAVVLALKWAWQLPLFCQVFNTLQGADNAQYLAISALKNAQWMPATAWDSR